MPNENQIHGTIHQIIDSYPVSGAMYAIDLSRENISKQVWALNFDDNLKAFGEKLRGDKKIAAFTERILGGDETHNFKQLSVIANTNDGSLDSSIKKIFKNEEYDGFYHYTAFKRRSYYLPNWLLPKSYREKRKHKDSIGTQEAKLNLGQRQLAFQEKKYRDLEFALSEKTFSHSNHTHLEYLRDIQLQRIESAKRKLLLDSLRMAELENKEAPYSLDIELSFEFGGRTRNESVYQKEAKSLSLTETEDLWSLIKETIPVSKSNIPQGAYPIQTFLSINGRKISLGGVDHTQKRPDLNQDNKRDDESREQSLVIENLDPQPVENILDQEAEPEPTISGTNNSQTQDDTATLPDKEEREVADMFVEDDPQPVKNILDQGDAQPEPTISGTNNSQTQETVSLPDKEEREVPDMSVVDDPQPVKNISDQGDEPEPTISGTNNSQTQDDTATLPDKEEREVADMFVEDDPQPVKNILDQEEESPEIRDLHNEQDRKISDSEETALDPDKKKESFWGIAKKVGNTVKKLIPSFNRTIIKSRFSSSSVISKNAHPPGGGIDESVQVDNTPNPLFGSNAEAKKKRTDKVKKIERHIGFEKHSGSSSEPAAGTVLDRINKNKELGKNKNTNDSRPNDAPPVAPPRLRRGERNNKKDVWNYSDMDRIAQESVADANLTKEDIKNLSATSFPDPGTKTMPMPKSANVPFGATGKKMKPTDFFPDGDKSIGHYTAEEPFFQNDNVPEEEKEIDPEQMSHENIKKFNTNFNSDIISALPEKKPVKRKNRTLPSPPPVDSTSDDSGTIASDTSGQQDGTKTPLVKKHYLKKTFFKNKKDSTQKSNTQTRGLKKSTWDSLFGKKAEDPYVEISNAIRKEEDKTKPQSDFSSPNHKYVDDYNDELLASEDGELNLSKDGKELQLNDNIRSKFIYRPGSKDFEEQLKKALTPSDEVIDDETTNRKTHPHYQGSFLAPKKIEKNTMEQQHTPKEEEGGGSSLNPMSLTELFQEGLAPTTESGNLDFRRFKIPQIDDLSTTTGDDDNNQSHDVSNIDNEENNSVRHYRPPKTKEENKEKKENDLSDLSDSKKTKKRSRSRRSTMGF